MFKNVLIWTLGVLAVLFIAVQFIPLVGAKINPPVIAESTWDSPQTRALALNVCSDCHSNETAWPWYSNVAPVSWLVIDDTNKGREYLNFSEWNRPQEEAGEAAETVRDSSMSLPVYLIEHPEARLSEQEKALLVQGLQRTLGGELESFLNKTVSREGGEM